MLLGELMERKMECCWENLLRGKWSIAGKIYGEENGVLLGEFMERKM